MSIHLEPGDTRESLLRELIASTAWALACESLQKEVDDLTLLTIEGDYRAEGDLIRLNRLQARRQVLQELLTEPLKLFDQSEQAKEGPPNPPRVGVGVDLHRERRLGRP